MPRNPRPAPSTIRLYVALSGPRKGDPECQAAFKTKDDAVQFLVDLHGLEFDDAKKLKREWKLSLKRKIHGAELCKILEEEMHPSTAKKALTGELYLQEAPRLLTPRKLKSKAAG